MFRKICTTAITLFVLCISVDVVALDNIYDPGGATWLAKCGSYSDSTIQRPFGGIICCSKTWGYCVLCPKDEKCRLTSIGSKNLPGRTSSQLPPISVMESEILSRRQKPLNLK